MPKASKPTVIINQLYDEMLLGNFNISYELADPSYRSHTEQSEVDPESLKRSCEKMMAPLKDLQREVLFEFNKGDLGIVVHRYSWVDEASGKRRSLRSADTYRTRDNKLLEHWGVLQFEDPIDD